jgi:hypothetical protein
MKDFITPSLTFVPGASGAGYVDLFGIAGFDIRRLVSLINQTTGTIIYSTADTSLRWTNVIGTQVYLLFDTSAMSSANVIQVVYDTPYPLPVSAAALPLPFGAATAANQSTQTAILTNIDSNTPALVGGRVPVDGSGVTQPISAIALPLPTGAATESRQADGNASLTSIDSKTPVLVGGQVPVVISASVPVTGPLTDAQLRFAPVPVSVSGTAAVTGPLTDTQLRATPVPISGTVTASTGLAQPLTDAQLRAAAIDVNVTGTVLAVGAATSSNQGTANTLLTLIEADSTAIAGSVASIDTKTPSTSIRVLDNEAPGSPVRAIGQEIWNVSFSEVGASVISSQFVTPLAGTGVSYNQGSGALNIVAGTTTNAEFFTRSVQNWRGAMRLKFSIVSSNRIVNNNLAVMLADLVGEGLTVTINSATSITVTQAGHAFTATSVGQFVQIGRIVGAAGVPGRYAIASVVAGTSYNLTVAGWPASGSCTATVFGHSYVRNLVTGATATAINVDAQRRGWAQGDTAATINTTASPGTIITSELTGREVFWADQLRASTTTPTVVTRANRLENIPDDNLDLYLFIWSFNGMAAPASSTTWTISFCAIEKFANMPVYLQGNRANGAMNPLPISVIGTATVSGTVTANIGTGTLTAANLNIPGIIADVASAAIASTATAGPFTPTFGTCYSVNIPVTAISGTPTLDVGIEESDDSGTNWFRVYDFPRITATGMYRSPVMRLVGNRVRYVQTVGGGSPSVTRSINRLQSSTNNEAIRQLIDRTISLTTLNSTTPSLDTRDCGNRNQLVINVGAITTTAPAIQLEGSDDNGASWYSIGSPLTAVANSTVQLTVPDVNAAITRGRISTAGVGVTAGYVMLKSHD